MHSHLLHSNQLNLYIVLPSYPLLRRLDSLDGWDLLLQHGLYEGG